MLSPREHGRLKLAPAFDVLPTNSGQGFQEFVCGSAGQESTLANAMSQCDAFGLTAGQAAQELAQVVRAVNGWREHFVAAGVSGRDIECLAERIDADPLRSQRENFEPSSYEALAVRPRRGGAFSRRGRFEP